MAEQKTQNTISTLYEFTSKGYEDVRKNLAELSAKTADLQIQEKELQKAHQEAVNSADALNKKWQELNATMGSGTPKEVREYFAALPQQIEAATAAQAKFTSQKQQNSLAIAQESQNIKQAEEAQKNYRRALNELDGGMEKSTVTIESLTRAKKALVQAMNSQPTGSQEYLNMSKDVANVQNAINNLNSEFGLQAKVAQDSANGMSQAMSQTNSDFAAATRQAGIHENSIAALRLRYNTLQDQIAGTDMADPGFANRAKQAKMLSEELATAEAEIGNFSGSTGNYKSIFDGIGTSISQLAGDAPAFAQSMGAGLTAMSKNIPNLVDQINQLRTHNAALNAEGQKTPPIWQTLLKAGISWNSAISIGISLLTVYGKDIADWAVSLVNGEKAALSAAEAQQEINKSMAQGDSSHARQLITLQDLQNQWNALGNDMQAKEQFVKDNKAAFDTLGASVTDVAGAEKILVTDTDQFIESMNLKAKSVAAFNLAVKYQEEALKKQQEAQDRLKNGPTIGDYAKVLLGIDAAGSVGDMVQRSADKLTADAARATENASAMITASMNLEQQATNTLTGIGVKTVEVTNADMAARKELADTIAKEDAARKAAQDAANKRADEVKRQNEEYKKSYADVLRAKEDLAQAEASGDAKAIDLYKKILAEKETALANSSAAKLTLTQGELDEMELQEYLSGKRITKINQDAQKDKVQAYIKADNEVRTAKVNLLEAQKRGDAKEIELNEEKLRSKQEALDKFNQEELELSKEQQLEKEMAEQEAQQVATDQYIALRQQQMELEAQFDQAANQEKQAVIQTQLDAVNAQIDAQVGGLELLGVVASEIMVPVKQAAETQAQELSEQLEKSMGLINEYAGKSKSIWTKTASSISSLVMKVFDFRELTPGMDESIEDFNKRKDEMIQGMAQLEAKVVLESMNAVTDTINQNLEKQKESINELYTHQEERAQESYDTQSTLLKRKLEKNEISEAKYKLEQMKLDDKKAEEDKEREVAKANALYEIELKQFRLNQANAAIGVVIATALGIAQAWVSPGFPAAIPLVAVLAGLGIAQTALIYAQKAPPKPSFAKGGAVRFEQLEGPSHSNGGIPIRFGNKVVAEAEGDEGALIISKKAMRNSYMRSLLQQVEQANADISGTQQTEGMFEEGGAIEFKTYDELFKKARERISVGKITKKYAMLNKNKYKLKDYDNDIEKAKDAEAEKNAKFEWNHYIDTKTLELKQMEKDNVDKINAGIAGNSTLSGKWQMKNVEDYYETVEGKENDLDAINKKISVYKEEADARSESLKAGLLYDEKMAKFDKRKQEAAEQQTKETEDFNLRVLGELRDSAKITTEEYDEMCEQIKAGYGTTTQDIINLKKKEVEATKKLIEQNRDAELQALEDTYKYRQDALEQLRDDWSDNYNNITDQIIEDVENASEAAATLTGTDLERYNQILAIQQDIKKMNEEYQNNETLLTDGVVQSREERAALVAEQQRIMKELELKEKEAEEAKAAFEQERQKNMESALKQYEETNYQAILEQIKAMGSDLQAEDNKWSMDKQLAADLDNELKQVNQTYDDQIAKQDAIVKGLEDELKQIELNHDKKMAAIKSEEEALEALLKSEQGKIDKWLSDSTSEMHEQASNLAYQLATLKVAGQEAGLNEYEKAIKELTDLLDDFDAAGNEKKLANGGAIDLGNGLYQVSGPSHSQGGVPVSVGNTQIAEVEGIEKMFAVNKLAAHDPEMIAALTRASNVNARYTGVPLLHSSETGGFSIDYDLLAAKIGAQINARPVKSYLTHREVKSAYDITQMHRRSGMMN